MKLPKIDLVCGGDDWRPQYGCVMVNKEFTYATNAHIAIKHRTAEIFKDPFIESLPESGILIPERAFAVARKTSTTNISLSENKDKIILSQKDGSEIAYLLYSGNPFPNVDSVIPDKKDCKPLSEIALSSRLLHRLADGMGCNNGFVHLYFYEPTKTILAVPNQDSDYFGVIGIIMPCVIQN